MLLRAVPERALGALLGGEPIAATLCQYLSEAAVSVKGNVSIEQWKGKLRRAIQADVDMRTAGRHRLNELNTAAEQLCDDEFLTGRHLPVLDAVFNEIMECRDSQIHFKYEQVQRFAELVCEVDPTVLVAWQLAAMRAPSGTVMRQTVESLSTLFVGPLHFGLPFAENHSHLNGIMGDEFVLAELVLFFRNPPPQAVDNEISKPKDPAPESPNTLRQKRIHRLLEAFVKIWKTVGDLTRIQLDQHDKMLAAACLNDVASETRNPVVDWKALDTSINVNDNAVNNQWMVKQLGSTASHHKLQHAWTWLFTLLWRTYRDSNRSPQTRSAVLLLVADIMVLRRQLIMDGSGLRRFTTGYTFSSPRIMASAQNLAWKGVSQKEAIRRMFVRPDDSAEIKISASTFNGEFTLNFAHDVETHLSLLRPVHQKAPAGSPSSSPLDQWHFCLHFNRSGSKRRHARRAELWGEATNVKKILQSKNKWDLAPLLNNQKDLGSMHQLLPAQFVRGLDVAGDETGWPIEVFAPMLRWLRHKEQTDTTFSPPDTPTQSLHLSVHAGEDYAHPLSGLRQVDETVVFCGMRHGDRLGHALALGISPDEWLRRHGDVVLPVDEHFDNLVWAWHEVALLATDEELLKVLPQIKKVLQRLEQRIGRFFPHISWHPPGRSSVPELRHLYGAWKLRENCSYLVVSKNKNTNIGGSSLEIGAPDLSNLPADSASPDMASAAGLYVQRAKVERDAWERTPPPPVMVRVSQLRHGHASRAQRTRETEHPDAMSQMHDHDDMDDLRVILALQDVCIERYANAGISIETNPTSNVYIGQLETHSDHPIYRWHPPDIIDLAKFGKYNEFGLRTMLMPVTINTDDQGIIPTTLRMEHHLMHEAALERGHDLAMVDKWIEDLRILAIRHFNDTHQHHDVISATGSEKSRNT